MLTSRFHIALVVLLSLCGLANAQDSAMYQLGREQITAYNIQTLEEALDYLPGFHLVTRDGQRELHHGLLTLQGIGIYKDGIPLAMDQNVGYDLSTITTWDLEKIEVHYASIEEINKSGGTLQVHLYSRQAAEQPFWGNITAINTTNGDLNANAAFSLNTLKHSIKVAGGRGFRRELYAPEELRATAINPAERYDLNLVYTFRPFPSLKIQVGSDNTHLREQAKGAVIENTTRVEDENIKFNRHHHYMTLLSDLSKNHKLIVAGAVQQYEKSTNQIDKDLNSQKSESSESLYNQQLRYSFLSMTIKSVTTPLSYSVGLELSNTKDLQNEIIDAIPTQYADYTAHAHFRYRYRDNFSVGGGARLLTNNLTGTFLLPSAEIVLAPSKELTLHVNLKESVFYPMLWQSFNLPMETRTTDHNLLLEPIKQDIVHVRAAITQQNAHINTGILFTRLTDIPSSTPQKWTNSERNRTTTTYATLVYKTKYVELVPSALIHGMTNNSDTTTLTFFTPEASLSARIDIPKTPLTLNSTLRLIGRRNSVSSAESQNLDEINTIRLLTAELRYTPTVERPLSLHFGVANILNTTFISNKIYTLTAVDRILTEDNPVTAFRPRNFYIRASYTL